MNLWLLDVASGDTLYSDQRSYSSVEELLQDTGRLASALVRASRQQRIVEPDDRDERRKREPELEAAAGFRIGQESVTTAPGIDGGSHLYAEVLVELNSAGYLISTDYRGESHHYIGARLCPIHSGNIGGISIELLPLSVFFDLAGGQPVVMFELLSIAFWLPYD